MKVVARTLSMALAAAVATPAFAQVPAPPAPQLTLSVTFGSPRKEVLPNGVQLREDPKRRSMSCPADETCTTPMTIMLVAAVVSGVAIAAASKGK